MLATRDLQARGRRPAVPRPRAAVRATGPRCRRARSGSTSWSPPRTPSTWTPCSTRTRRSSATCSPTSCEWRGRALPRGRPAPRPARRAPAAPRPARPRPRGRRLRPVSRTITSRTAVTLLVLAGHRWSSACCCGWTRCSSRCPATRPATPPRLRAPTSVQEGPADRGPGGAGQRLQRRRPRSGLAERDAGRARDAGLRARARPATRPRAPRSRARPGLDRPQRNDAAARLVAQPVRPATKVRSPSTDLGPGVDVVVGDASTSSSRAEPSPVVKRTPSRACHAASRPGDVRLGRRLERPGRSQCASRPPARHRAQPLLGRLAQPCAGSPRAGRRRAAATVRARAPASRPSRTTSETDAPAGSRSSPTSTPCSRELRADRHLQQVGGDPLQRRRLDVEVARLEAPRHPQPRADPRQRRAGDQGVDHHHHEHDVEELARRRSTSSASGIVVSTIGTAPRSPAHDMNACSRAASGAERQRAEHRQRPRHEGQQQPGQHGDRPPCST